jgi:ribosomal protein L22
MNMAPNMAGAMGGGMQAPMEQQAPQFQPQQFNQQQVMQRAGANNLDQSKAYQAELVNQLRGGTYKDAQGVWGNALNNYDQAQQMKAFQAQQAQQAQMQQQEAAASNWMSGDGG